MYQAIRNKEDYPKDAMYIDREYVDYDYSRNHENIVISDVLSVIDEVILFKLSNYFLKVSKAYKEIRGKDPDHDWYEFLEYGSTNEDTINIQKHGFSRESAIYILEHPELVVQIKPLRLSRKSIDKCKNQGVKNDAELISYNIPELFEWGWTMGISFRHSAGFGKRMEYNLVGKMLMEGLDVYMPLVDDHGVDCVIKKADGTFIEVQIKARSNEVTDGDAALFSAITHELTENFYFVFYSERLDMMWIMSSEEFLNECVTNRTGKNKGKRGIWFNGNRTDKKTGVKTEYCKKQFEKYLAADFSRFH